MAYQTAGWLCYGLVLLVHTSCSGVANAYAMCTVVPVAYLGLMAEIFIVSSLLALEKQIQTALRSPRSASKAPLFLHNYMNLLAVVAAFFLALSAERVDGAYTTNASLGSLLLCIAAVTSTYGLGGILASEGNWKFWQPFSGGVTFVAIQFVSWLCFTFSVVLQGVFFLSLMVVEVKVFVGIMGVAGMLSVASQVGMMVSVFVYAPAPTSSGRLLHAMHQQAMRNIDMMFPTLMINLPPIAFLPYALPWTFVPSFTWFDVGLYFVGHVAMQTFMSIPLSHLLQVYFKKTSAGASVPFMYWCLPLLFSAIPLVSVLVHYAVDHPAAHASAAFAVPWYLYNVVTMRGMPAQTGCRQDKSLLHKRSALMDATARYFSLNLLRTAPLSATDTYIFGFHPHGIIPMTVMWLQFTSQWRALFPGVFACPLSASVVHYFPGMRDVIQILGAREVTRQTFSDTLNTHQSVFVVPGGQAELVESRSRQNQVRVFTGHKGFVRLALEHGVSLVPVLSFQEGEILDNVRWPKLQRWFIKRFAFPCPYYPHGWTGLPIPNRVPLTIAVGAPIPVAKVAIPTQAQVDQLHTHYFDQLRQLFLDHKDAAGCSDYELIYIAA
ncbi:hypothetical protein H310_11917 [Aphanomyces invadans]|uniref:Acyltransferase n=1 Tax=Aphanomyces invadans TaxID=157072 RepID=A0A024TJR6_9STRA|nr:hypothetical protein H310_11917 [Aphanomyces invadans]ETV94239.1 hypothetical protein H310_11917 [Aphanomyces invadans]|eukprot:XP_008877001.1 hypothetical protein H310_11917 [Aphanomyces invadans]